MTLLPPVFDFLVATDAKGLVQAIAERWTVAPDGLSWTFNIRKGVKFHNGDALTANDVKFSWEQYAAPGAFYTVIGRAVDRIEVVDDYTVRVFTKGVQIYLPFPAADFTIQVMPKNYIESKGWPNAEANPVGSGPFKFVRHLRGDVVDYEALDTHWRQVPSFRKLSVALVPEEATRVAMLKAGAVDLIDIGMDSGVALETAGFRTQNMDVATTMVILHGAYQPEAAKMPIADLRVRQALSLAINRDEIRKTFFYGKAGPPSPPYLWEGSPDLDTAYWMSYAANTYRYDADAAKQLLKDAGYGNGFTISLYAFSIRGASFLPQLGEVVAGYWKKVGVNTTIVPSDSGTYNSIRNPLRVPTSPLLGQAAVYRGTASIPTVQNLQSPFSSTGAGAVLGKSRPDLDNLLARANSEPDATKRKDLLAQVLKPAFDSYTVLMLASAPSMAALGPRVNITFPFPTKGLGLAVDIAKHR